MLNFDYGCYLICECVSYEMAVHNTKDVYLSLTWTKKKHRKEFHNEYVTLSLFAWNNLPVNTQQKNINGYNGI